MRSLTVLAAAALVMMVTVVPGAQAPTSAQALRRAGPPVTFTKDVAPILQRSCQNCHRPDSNAPMSLITYEDARPYARSIKAKTASRLMPPWHVERNIGIQKFKDDPSLTEQEIATIAAWVDQGAQKGDMANMPPPRKFDGRRRVAHRQAGSHRRDSAAACGAREPARTSGSITSPTAGSLKIGTCRRSRRSPGPARARSCITC